MPTEATAAIRRGAIARAPFPVTSASLLFRIQVYGEAATDAREEFVRRYYAPVHDLIGAILRDPENAQDLTQGFFAHCFTGNRLLVGWQRDKGKFRHYMKQAVRNFVQDWIRKDRRERAHRVERSDDGPDPLAVSDPASSPDTAFERAWVRGLVRTAVEEVGRIAAAKGQQVHYELFLQRYLSEADTPPAWRELGRPFDLDERQARERAEAAVRHFRFVLRRLLADEIGEGAGIDDEISGLLSYL